VFKAKRSGEQADVGKEKERERTETRRGEKGRTRN